MKTNELTIGILAMLAVMAFFAIFAGPPAILCYTMGYPYYVYEVIQGFWAVFVLGVSFLGFQWFFK